MTTVTAVVKRERGSSRGRPEGRLREDPRSRPSDRASVIRLGAGGRVIGVAEEADDDGGDDARSRQGLIGGVDPRPLSEDETDELGDDDGEGKDEEDRHGQGEEREQDGLQGGSHGSLPQGQERCSAR
ncbi:Uncharacterised protein [Mycobacteroides abscessus subsp. abscessus]|nr:Uncharacterised protein [Mycobacteroides abscessus subsp. abscessus]